MPIKEGIILYDIESDGCLNGVYTNEVNNQGIFNEIAKKRPMAPGKDPICGDYDCFYFDQRSSQNYGVLTITSNLGNGYDFSWNLSGKLKLPPQFKGIGYKMNEKQIAVHYWET